MILSAKLYFKLQIIISILILLSLEIFKDQITLDNKLDDLKYYNSNFISNFNELNPNHWTVLLANNNYKNLFFTIKNSIQLSKNDNKTIATYYAIKFFSKLSINEKNEILMLISK